MRGEYEDNEELDTQRDKYLTFRLGHTYFGIDIRHVIEIIGRQHIAPVPETPGYIRGIINLRGSIIPVMDVRLRFHMPFREYDDRTCIVVVQVDDVPVGLIVDHVSEVLTIPADQIELPPTYNKTDFIKGIAKLSGEIKLLLDCNQLLYARDSETIVQTIGEASQ